MEDVDELFAVAALVSALLNRLLPPLPIDVVDRVSPNPSPPVGIVAQLPVTGRQIIGLVLHPQPERGLEFALPTPAGLPSRLVTPDRQEVQLRGRIQQIPDSGRDRCTQADRRCPPLTSLPRSSLRPSNVTTDLSAESGVSPTNRATVMPLRPPQSAAFAH